MNRVIPTIFAVTKKDFNERFNKLIRISKRIHVDIMDGKFVKSRSSPIANIPPLGKYKNIFEAHLMVNQPDNYLTKLKSKGFKKIIFHYEALKQQEIPLFARAIKKLNLVPVLAINPETSVKQIKPLLPSLKEIMLMGVHPGREYQNLIPTTLKRIREIKKINKRVIIQIDGGINEKTIVQVTKAGADFVNSGSYISDAKNPKETINKLNNLLSKNK